MQVGDKASDIHFNFTDGSSTSLSALQQEGKTVMLQFTGSWCKVCREEMPHIEKEIWQVYKDKGLIVIGVDYDESLEKVINFKEHMKVTYPLALDPGAEIFARFAEKGSGVTRNVIIDKKGEIVFLTRLFDPEEFSRMIEKIDQLVTKNANQGLTFKYY